MAGGGRWHGGNRARRRTVVALAAALGTSTLALSVGTAGSAHRRPSPPAAQLPALRWPLDSASSRVWFDGTSTFGAFTATSASLAGWVELVAPGQLADARGEVSVRAATLRTGIGLRDRHLRDELDTDRFPLVTLAVARVVPAQAAYAGASEGTPVVLRGSLTVRGQSHPVAFDATAGFHGDTLVVVGRAPLRFTELGMKPPSKLLGSVKVHDDFVLRFDGRFLAARP